MSRGVGCCRVIPTLSCSEGSGRWNEMEQPRDRTRRVGSNKRQIYSSESRGMREESKYKQARQQAGRQRNVTYSSRPWLYWSRRGGTAEPPTPLFPLLPLFLPPRAFEKTLVPSALPTSTRAFLFSVLPATFGFLQSTSKSPPSPAAANHPSWEPRLAQEAASGSRDPLIFGSIPAALGTELDYRVLAFLIPSIFFFLLVTPLFSSQPNVLSHVSSESLLPRSLVSYSRIVHRVREVLLLIGPALGFAFLQCSARCSVPWLNLMNLDFDSDLDIESCEFSGRTSVLIFMFLVLRERWFDEVRRTAKRQATSFDRIPSLFVVQLDELSVSNR